MTFGSDVGEGIEATFAAMRRLLPVMRASGEPALSLTVANMTHNRRWLNLHFFVGVCRDGVQSFCSARSLTELSALIEVDDHEALNGFKTAIAGARLDPAIFRSALVFAHYDALKHYGRGDRTNQLLYALRAHGAGPAAMYPRLLPILDALTPRAGRLKPGESLTLFHPTEHEKSAHERLETLDLLDELGTSESWLRRAISNIDRCGLRLRRTPRHAYLCAFLEGPSDLSLYGVIDLAGSP